tara:strand:- start:630 stop:848 length:219 start_codon:yes stop_codon:yes gene_type:complete
MELPIDHKDLKTIVNALSLGGDTRLYFLLKNIVDDRKLQETTRELDIHHLADEVKVFSESDDYQCKHVECDI